MPFARSFGAMDDFADNGSPFSPHFLSVKCDMLTGVTLMQF